MNIMQCTVVVDHFIWREEEIKSVIGIESLKDWNGIFRKESFFVSFFSTLFSLHLERRPHKSFTITLCLMDWECQTLRMFASKWKFHIENNGLVTLFECAWHAWPLRIYEWKKTSFFRAVGKTSQLISSFIFQCTRHELNDHRAH